MCTHALEGSVMIRYVDIKHILADYESKCYLSHHLRTEDTDDIVLDVANQLDFTVRDLSAWLKSRRSWDVMEEAEVELDISDFMHELTTWINR